jgi:hypothetical protein
MEGVAATHVDGRPGPGYVAQVRESLGWISCVAMLLAACSVDGAGGGGEDFVGDSEGPDTSVLSQMPARGIEIREIEVNQASRVVIGEGGDWVDVEQRSLGLIASRDSLVRVHYRVAPGWIPHAIEARLTLEYPDGTQQVLSAIKQVEGDSTLDPLDGGFWFSLSAGAGQTEAQIEYRVELWETGDDVGETMPELAWANPDEGTRPIGFEAIPLELKVVLVPIHYLPADKTPMLDDAAIAELIDDLYEQNPTNSVVYDVRDPVDYASSINDISVLLPLLSELKTTDQADANVYYHALIDVGMPTIGGLRGIGNIVGDSEAEGAMRVAATVYWSADTSLAAETFTHEIGHNQGLVHVACPNTEADGIQSEFPHGDGLIGDWGAGVRRLQVFDPDVTFDYMSYCGPSWVSDWTWNQTRARIATLTAWDYEGGTEPSDTWTLIGALQTDGTTHWWTAPGEVDPERVGGSDRVTFVTDEGEVVEQWAQVDTLSDGVTQWIKVELPIGFDRIAALTHQRGEAIVEIPIDAVVTRLAVDPWTPQLRAR